MKKKTKQMRKDTSAYLDELIRDMTELKARVSSLEDSRSKFGQLFERLIDARLQDESVRKKRNTIRRKRREVAGLMKGQNDGQQTGLKGEH